MAKNGNIKASKELQRKYGKLVANLSGYQDHIDFRSFDNFTDEAFSYLMEKVKGVNMLDLNETDITNKSIALLTRMEYVNELRAKECRNLDDGCTEDLNKLNPLVFLHLKRTNVTIDGLLKLNKLINLKTLLFSAEDIVPIKEKLLQLKTMLPQCKLVINSRPYCVNAVDIFICTLRQLTFTYRLKIKNEALIAAWSNWLRQDGFGNIEAEAQGSVLIDAIEWVEIKPNIKPAGEKQTTKIAVGDFDTITKLLEVLEFPYMVDKGVFSVYLLNKEV